MHRLVARTFIGVRPTLDMGEINHKDSGKANNHVDNLEYVTRAQNMQHMQQRGGIARVTRPVLWRPVGKSEWAQFRSTSEAARVSKNQPRQRVPLL